MRGDLLDDVINAVRAAVQISKGYCWPINNSITMRLDVQAAIRIITVSHQDQSSMSQPGRQTDLACAVCICCVCMTVCFYLRWKKELVIDACV